MRHQHGAHIPASATDGTQNSFRRMVSLAKDCEGAANEIDRGFPAAVLRDISNYFQVPLKQIRAIAQVPANLNKTTSIGADASERVWRLASVASMATDVFDDENAAKQWLRTPHMLFMNAAPLDYLDTEARAASVRQVLNAIATGGAV